MKVTGGTRLVKAAVNVGDRLRWVEEEIELLQSKLKNIEEGFKKQVIILNKGGREKLIDETIEDTLEKETTTVHMKVKTEASWYWFLHILMHIKIFQIVLCEMRYGELQGINKQESADKYGKEQVHKRQRSYDIHPPKPGKKMIHYDVYGSNLNYKYLVQTQALVHNKNRMRFIKRMCLVLRYKLSGLLYIVKFEGVVLVEWVGVDSFVIHDGGVLHPLEACFQQRCPPSLGNMSAAEVAPTIRWMISRDSSHVSAKKTTPTKSELEKKNPNNMRRLHIPKLS
ncbi:hypothetical protein CTI12_AA579080 [Artemisia annua]|uniref:Uncharacterized protein n=1 Tax=Artemisia annua TaxID=35608 RepID=A0A2U1KPU5_ARTAN|nr:hypothetical protein CTI12_AA579080 [Artemisia annua]